MTNLCIDRSELCEPARKPTLPRLGIINDYVRIPYANGSSFASQFLYREFRRRGSHVTVVGAKDPETSPAELPPQHVCFASVPLRNHPGVRVSFPNRRALRQLTDAGLSLVVAQTGSALMQAGLWLRRKRGVPLVCVNTMYIPALYEVLLPQSMNRNSLLARLLRDLIVPWAERSTARVFNGADGVVVLSSGLREYWRKLGVTVPISVIPRGIDPTVFNGRYGDDPFPSEAPPGGRLLVVCRHTREKNVERLLEIFAKQIAPRLPGATLTLVGDGPDHDLFREAARRLGVAERCYFPGEISLPEMQAWYRHADLFLYTSLSETYGQVVSEALWCGLPVVAFEDDKGVSDQVDDDSDGYLVSPDGPRSDELFAARVLELLRDPARRAAFSKRAEAKAKRRSDPERCVRAYEETFRAAVAHYASNPASGGWMSRILPVLHWAFAHLLLAVLGCVRPPATVNRHGRRQPGWDASDVVHGQLAPTPPERRLKSVPSAA